MCKPIKCCDFLETNQPIRFVSFKEFPWVSYSRCEDRTYYLHYVLFRHKNGKVFTKNHIDHGKQQKKHSKNLKIFQRNTQKDKYYFPNL